MTGGAAIALRAASTADDLLIVRQLFQEYAASLGFNLNFQDFETELATLPGAYSRPRGALFLAVDGESPAGCVGVRPLEAKLCEMKRLYVRPGFRGKRLGLLLAQAAITSGRQAGYQAMRLDTLPSMQEAQALYLRLGFREIPPYRFNPIPDTRYLELDLTEPGGGAETPR
jgi:ribosomal protein S18 acetylase RimI-like enzyme